ncbi:MAG: ATP-binding protein [Pseudomonadota bacterium]
MNSLRSRLVLSGALILALFGVFTFIALNRAFHASALSAQEERMKGMTYLLLGFVDVQPGGSLTFNELAVQDQRFFTEGSGLMGAMVFEDGTFLWKSHSWKDAVVGPIPKAETGQWLFEPLSREASSFFKLSFGVTWVLKEGVTRKFTIMLVEDSTALAKQLRTYHGTLAHWLGGAAALLLLSLVVILRWGLLPLRRVAAGIGEIQDGKKEQLQGDWPKELRPLTEGLNSLLRHERGRQKRYRNALDDLAHSLKTPLAALRGFVKSTAEPDSRRQMEEQIDRIGKTLDYQVRKASTAGRSAFTQPIDFRQTAQKVVSALSKVYREKSVVYDLGIDGSPSVSMDEGDLMEILGNLADNASKWAARTVRIEARIVSGRLVILVDDDGPGFPKEGREHLLGRGVRADRRMPGEGIGLAVVSEIVALYGGSMKLSGSDLGGGRVEIQLPV